MTLEFDPFDPDAIDRAQRRADGELEEDTTANNGGEGDGEGSGASANAGTGAADAGAGAGGAAAGNGADGAGQGQADAPAEGASTGKPAGVSSKDGKHVLPYSALAKARNEASAHRSRAEAAEREAAAARAELEAVRSGKAPDKAEGDDLANLTEEEIAEIEADYPQLAKLARVAKLAVDRVGKTDTQAATKPAAQNDEPSEPSGDPVQDAIDMVPDLLAWQTDPAHADKFALAVQHDNALKASPKWANRPMEERFAEAARRVREEFDIAEEQSTSSKDKTDDKANEAVHGKKAQDVIDKATERKPNTLSDLNGGARPASASVANMTPVSMLNKFMSMTPEEMMEQLDRGA
jgi:hypothetical protein